MPQVRDRGSGAVIGNTIRERARRCSGRSLTHCQDLVSSRAPLAGDRCCGGLRRVITDRANTGRISLSLRCFCVSPENWCLPRSLEKRGGPKIHTRQEELG